MLIAAFHSVAATGSAGRNLRALEVLRDPNRVFLSSLLLELELLPKAIYHKNHLEQRFYETFFSSTESLEDANRIVNLARQESERTGVNAMDALHLAAAFLLHADEFITTETPQKPLHRSRLMKVTYLFG